MDDDLKTIWIVFLLNMVPVELRVTETERTFRAKRSNGGFKVFRKKDINFFYDHREALEFSMALIRRELEKHTRNVRNAETQLWRVQRDLEKIKEIAGC